MQDTKKGTVRMKSNTLGQSANCNKDIGNYYLIRYRSTIVVTLEVLFLLYTRYAIFTPENVRKGAKISVPPKHHHLSTG